MAFEGLSSKLQTVFKKLSGRGKLSEKDVKEAMREVRLALLEADVSCAVVKKFIAQVSQRAVGAEGLESLTPGQQVIKIVNEELTNLMGGANAKIAFANSGPTWGSSAKRITVVRHTGFWGIGFAKVSDLTLQDVAVCRTGAYDGVNTEGYGPCGTFLLNADGLQMRGCTAEKLVLPQRSRRAKRPAIVEGCWFRDGIEVVRTGEAAVAPGTPLILRDNLTGPGGPQQAEGTE